MIKGKKATMATIHRFPELYRRQSMQVIRETTLEDNYNWKTYNSWWGTYEAVPAIKALYVFLGALGYEPSDEEVALIEGTSELYARKEEKTDA